METPNDSSRDVVVSLPCDCGRDASMRLRPEATERFVAELQSRLQGLPRTRLLTPRGGDMPATTPEGVS